MVEGEVMVVVTDGSFYPNMMVSDMCFDNVEVDGLFVNVHERGVSVLVGLASSCR